MDKTVIYLRVSSKGQEENGYSLDAQEKLAREYAAKKGLEVVKIWKGAESAWGKIERTNFSEMLAFMKKHHEVRHIIFDVLDRMTRNDVDKLKIAQLVKQYDKVVHFSRDNKMYSRESSSDEEFMMDVQVAVAKKLSNDISRKTTMGMTEKAEQGIYPARAPIGYLNNHRTSKIDIDPERAPFVQRLFEMAASGEYSLQMIEDILYAEGLRERLHNGRVRKSTLYRVLHNPMYYGTFRWARNSIRAFTNHSSQKTYSRGPIRPSPFLSAPALLPAIILFLICFIAKIAAVLLWGISPKRNICITAVPLLKGNIRTKNTFGNIS